MNHEYANNSTNPVYLKVVIIEPILQACINGSSFTEVYLSVQRVIPSSELVLREYMFYLLNSSFISYNGIKKKLCHSTVWLGPIRDHICPGGEKSSRI
jgi:hypothetical protein